MRILLFVWLLATPAWAGDCQSMVRAELFFGRSGVTDIAWADFLARVVTPRFPDGLTAWDARGQWRDPASGQIGRETSTVLLLIAPKADDLDQRLDEVRDAYKARYKQTSVGLVTQSVCAAF